MFVKVPRTFHIHLSTTHVNVHGSFHIPSCTTDLKAHRNSHVLFLCILMHHTGKGTCRFLCTFPMYLHAPHVVRHMTRIHIPTCTTQLKAHSMYIHASHLYANFHLHSCTTHVQVHYGSSLYIRVPCIFVCNTITST